MSKKEPLFELIHSLSFSEKGYFKKSCGSSERVYVKLFDLINNQASYSEVEILKAIRNESISKNFSVSKRYLYDSVLSALIQYQSQKNIESQLNNDIESIKILFNKGLHDQTEKLLNKAKEIARGHELFHHLLQLLAFEYSFNQFKMRNSEQLFKEEEEILARLQQVSNGNKWYLSVLSWVQKNDTAKSQQELDEISALFNNGLQQIDNTTFKGINTFHAANTIYNYSIGNMNEATNAKIQQLETYIANPKLREVNYKNFLLVYGNVLSLIYNNGDIEKFNEYYSRFFELKSTNSRQLILEKEIEFAHGVGLFKLSKDYEGGTRFLKKIEPELTSIEQKLSLIRVSDIQFNAAVMFFWIGDLRSSLKWLNKILDNEKIESRQFLHCYAKIFELVIHLELGNTQLLLSLSKSVFRYLYQRNKVHDFENTILNYLKKFIKTEAVFQKTLFNELKADLNELAKDVIKSKAMDHFDYIKWLDEKTA